MTRTPRFLILAATMFVAFASMGCEELDGRNRNRQANLMFREMQFIDAASEYQHALKQFDDPVVHYNLGLTYSKMYRPGYDKPILLGEATDPVCAEIPKTQPVQAQVCVKKADARDQSDKRRSSAS